MVTVSHHLDRFLLWRELGERGGTAEALLQLPICRGRQPKHHVTGEERKFFPACFAGRLLYVHAIRIRNSVMRFQSFPYAQRMETERFRRAESEAQWQEKRPSRDVQVSLAETGKQIRGRCWFFHTWSWPKGREAMLIVFRSMEEIFQLLCLSPSFSLRGQHLP